MSAPVRFLALILIGWTGVRAATLGLIPGFTVGYAKPAPPRAVIPIAATQFPPLPPFEPMESLSAQQTGYPYPAAMAGAVQVPVPVSYYLPYAYPVGGPSPQAAIPQRPQWQLPPPGSRPDFYAPIKRLEEWQVSTLTDLPRGRMSAAPILAQSPAKPRLDRLQMSSWALLRGPPDAGALASGGTLGGSQAGARITYAFNRFIAASLRTTSPIGGSRGAEVAGGVRFTPFRSIPVAITAERRQSISRFGGRSAFALFAEGGLYGQQMPMDFRLDAYLQAGVVGFRSRDLFADGALSMTRPIYGRLSAGFGVWGGAQPGLYRVDVGPRISFRIRDNIYAHVDWRQRLVGNSQPRSGPALTLAANF